jgi:hypothetical protein
VQNRPEPVSRTGEVMPYRPGIQTGIDAYEQDLQPGSYYVRHRLSICREELCLRRFPQRS